MTDRNIHRVAIAVIAVACAASWALGAKYHSIAWSVIAMWLSFALVVETYPRREK